MKAAVKARPLLLAGALLLTVGASGWTHWRKLQPVEAVEAVEAVSVAVRPAAIAAAAPAAAPAHSPGAADAGGAAGAVDLFAAVDWNPPPPPPPPPPVAVAAPPPQAPPLPFQFLGRTEVLGDAKGAVIHLRRDKEVISVREGERIDEQYQLARLGAGELEIVYLPLAAKQILVMGSR
ncbi:hypothetical protein [Pseudoduganella buxea]|uniref:Secretion system X translation initiation factor n=2 Tax=Pseudoduganella buxea TaxID=1949069 RepID=A0ABQ1KE13_9BURK|nr:hypothetical protein [Pseudoduganella buxea]GGB92576.1 hypothetical protein GCM10011572_13200 [Pseudoduganella buxea]